MHTDRRTFVKHLSALSVASLAPSLSPLVQWSVADAVTASDRRHILAAGYGPLQQCADSPELWIPEGFRCVRLSRSRTPSQGDAGFMVPNAMDGMGSFANADGTVTLVRNHEMTNSAMRAEPLGDRPYDPRGSGGTTTLRVRLSGSGRARQVQVLEEFVSLGGTHINCAGGITPWGSWLSCEETVAGERSGFMRPHGYIFEVPAHSRSAVPAVPLRAMGRMVHEAIAVDPTTGIVYETEDVRFVADTPDLPGSGFYRFIPDVPGALSRGGRLQMLAIGGSPGYNTVTGQSVGTRLPVQWVEITEPDPAAADSDASAVFREGLSRGGAVFDRLEGCFWGDSSCYFVSTSGGDTSAGQVWRYTPDSAGSGDLVLVFESPSSEVLDSPDNICVSPRGGVIICEDGAGEQYIRALSRDGSMVNLVMQPHVAGEAEPSEFAGSCFSPDGEVLFFNVQGSTVSYGSRRGGTYALWGPWDRVAGV